MLRITVTIYKSNDYIKLELSFYIVLYLFIYIWVVCALVWLAGLI